MDPSEPLDQPLESARDLAEFFEWRAKRFKAMAVSFGALQDQLAAAVRDPRNRRN